LLTKDNSTQAVKTLIKRTNKYWLAVLMTLLTVLPVFAADVVMEAPDILLTGVGFDVNVAGLDPQSTAELRLNGEVIATSSDGSIAVFDIVLSDTGTANFDVTQGGHSVVAQALTIIPG
jgi:hypothetical protein